MGLFVSLGAKMEVTSFEKPFEAAREILNAVTANTGIDFPRSTIKECYESLESIVDERGANWLFDAAKGVHLSTAGLHNWMEEVKEHLDKQDAITKWADARHAGGSDCGTCGEECAEWADEQCPSSKRNCGHHCNCSWTQDSCCWCGKKFEAEEV